MQGVIDHPLARSSRHGLEERLALVCEKLDRIFCKAGNLGCPIRIGWIVSQKLSVILDHHAAARCIDDDARHISLLHLGPPGIHISPHIHKCAL